MRGAREPRSRSPTRCATLSLLAALAVAAPALSAQDDSKSRPELKPTVGAEPPAGAVVLFDGKDLSHWVKPDGKTPAEWPVEDGTMTVGRGNIRTKDEFVSFKLHIEFQCPYEPEARGQARGNSGVYLQGQYELQVLDSYGLELQDNDCGAIYKQVVPKVNACLPPLQWQSYDITFHAPKVEGGAIQEKARLTVVHNGVTTIDNAAIAPTPGGLGGPPDGDGPILLQDHGDKVQYQNIWLVPIDE